MDLNHRPLPYQGSALTELSYRPLPFPGMRMALTPGKCRRDRLSHSPENPSVGLPEGDLDTATQMGDEVVDHGSNRGQRGDQDDVHRAEQHGVAEDPGGREPVADTRPRGRTRAGRDAAQGVLDRGEDTQAGEHEVQEGHGQQPHNPRYQ